MSIIHDAKTLICKLICDKCGKKENTGWSAVYKVGEFMDDRNWRQVYDGGKTLLICNKCWLKHFINS